MNEYLFRGKRKDNGMWVEGYYWLYDNKPKICCEGENADIEGYPVRKLFDFIDVIPETVGMWSGQTDRNGKKIFKGDILKGWRYPFYCAEDGTHNYFAVVVWFENSSAFGLYTHKAPQSKVRGASDGNTDFMEDFDSTLWGIIGNIYDNPELLEAKA